MNAIRLAGLITVAATVAAASPAMAQNEGGGASEERYQVVKKTDDGAEQQNYENSTITGVYSADLTDPDHGFYGLNQPDQQLYTGLIPRVRDTLPHLKWIQSRGANSSYKNRLTWIGYQRMPDKSRVFIQTGRPAEFEVTRGKAPNEIYIVLKNTAGTFYNFKRDMDCRWMHRAVGHIRSFRRGRDTVVSVRLLSNVEFSTSSDAVYVYLDLADGHLERREVPTKGQDDSTVYDDPDKG